MSCSLNLDHFKILTLCYKIITPLTDSFFVRLAFVRLQEKILCVCVCVWQSVLSRRFQFFEGFTLQFYLKNLTEREREREMESIERAWKKERARESRETIMWKSDLERERQGQWQLISWVKEQSAW